jgi:hypothetical protein
MRWWRTWRRDNSDPGRVPIAEKRGRDAVTEFTPHQLVEIILRSLKEAACDVDEGRVPVDGRVRLLPPGTTGRIPPNADGEISTAAE